MLLTEEQAKAKWCPMARVESSPQRALFDQSNGNVVPLPSPGIVSVNRGGAGAFDEVACVGSRCMMWRTVAALTEREETVLGQMPKGEGWRQVDRGDSYGLVWERQLAPSGGYCGLAGRPFP